MQNIDAPLMRKVITIITLIKLRIVFMSCSKPDPQQNRQTVFFHETLCASRSYHFERKINKISIIIVINTKQQQLKTTT